MAGFAITTRKGGYAIAFNCQRGYQVAWRDWQLRCLPTQALPRLPCAIADSRRVRHCSKLPAWLLGVGVVGLATALLTAQALPRLLFCDRTKSLAQLLGVSLVDWTGNCVANDSGVAASFVSDGVPARCQRSPL